MTRGNDRLKQRQSAIAAMREELARRVANWTHGKRDVTTTVPGLILHRRDAPEPGVCEFHPPGLALIVQGSKQVERGRETFTYDESRFLVTCMELPSMNRVLQASAERPYLTMILHFDMQAARQLVLEYDLNRHDGRSVVRGTDTAPTTKEVLSAFTRLLDLLDTPADIPFLGGLIQREILYRLLTSEEGNSLREAVSTNSQANRIAKAIAWLKENFHRPLRIEELAATVHMGVSTLHHHFQAVTAMSPLQYQKQLRLQEARRLLIMESLDVGSAAMRVGYESTTQFSREYSRLLDCLQDETCNLIAEAGEFSFGYVSRLIMSLIMLKRLAFYVRNVRVSCVSSLSDHPRKEQFRVAGLRCEVHCYLLMPFRVLFPPHFGQQRGHNEQHSPGPMHFACTPDKGRTGPQWYRLKRWDCFFEQFTKHNQFRCAELGRMNPPAMQQLLWNIEGDPSHLDAIMARR